MLNLLKSYSRNEIPKQAPVFEPAQIESFLSDSTLDDDPYWLVRRAGLSHTLQANQIHISITHIFR